MRILLSILISIAPILGFAQTTGKVLEANAALGIQSVPNFVINSNAEKNTNAILQSGGTLSRDCSGPEVINGTCSFDWISDTSGQYLKFTANTMPEGSKGFTCSAYMRFQMDTLGAAASAYVVVEDGSGNPISPQFPLYATYNSVAAANDGTTGLALIEGYPCKPNQENRFAIYRSASTSARIHFDEVHVVQFPNAMAAPAAIRTNEATYTATFSNFGTVSTQSLKFYQDGAFLWIRGTFTCGTPVGATGSFTFPTGFTSAANITTSEALGTWFRGPAKTSHGGAILIDPSSSSIFFSGPETFGSGSVNATAKSNGDVICISGDNITLQVKIPIAGANNANAIPASCINNPDCMNNFSAKVSSAGVVSDESYSFINGNASISDTSLFAITWDTSRFSVAPTCDVTAQTATVGADAAIEVAATTTGISIRTSANTTKTAYAFTISCSRAGTDVKPWGPIPWLTGMVSSNSTKSIQHEFVRVTGGNPPTLGNLSSSWLSFTTRTGAGDYTFTHTLGQQPECSIAGVVAASRRFVRFQTLNSTTIRTTIEDSAGTGSDTDFSLLCSVPRN